MSLFFFFSLLLSILLSVFVSMTLFVFVTLLVFVFVCVMVFFLCSKYEIRYAFYDYDDVCVPICVPVFVHVLITFTSEFMCLYVMSIRHLKLPLYLPK